MKFNVTPDEYGKILQTEKSHKRFLAKMEECGFYLNEYKIKKVAMKDILSNKKILQVLKMIGDD
ncbi:hypothetical protein AKUH4B111J_09210 [Apilactobacillus kunkeei]|nr:hypothetical protein AKUH4B104A_09210 [Apilactobacillus kunkeei]CAI2618099.1 hypothetical protein AKUH4B111J_09210 [Apilactobacillus kunkeei]